MMENNNKNTENMTPESFKYAQADGALPNNRALEIVSALCLFIGGLAAVAIVISIFLALGNSFYGNFMDFFYTFGSIAAIISNLLIAAGLVAIGFCLILSTKGDLIKIAGIIIIGGHFITLFSVFPTAMLYGFQTSSAVGLSIFASMFFIAIWLINTLDAFNVFKMSEPVKYACLIACALSFAIIFLYNAICYAYVSGGEIFAWFAEFAAVAIFSLLNKDALINRPASADNAAVGDNSQAAPSERTAESYNSYSQKEAFTIDSEPEGFLKIWVLIVLSVVTFGIYGLIWIYRTVSLLNRKNLTQDSPAVQVVLCMFVPFYIIYWVYKYSKAIDAYGLRLGQPGSDLPIVNLILTVFSLSLIAYALMQDQINKNLLAETSMNCGAKAPAETPVVSKYVPAPEFKAASLASTSDTASVSNPETSAAPAGTATAAPAAPAVNASHEKQITLLKQLKELLDEGILTEEEFEKKKKEILGSK